MNSVESFLIAYASEGVLAVQLFFAVLYYFSPKNQKALAAILLANASAQEERAKVYRDSLKTRRWQFGLEPTVEEKANG